jgi:hypothetical protein
MQRGKMRVEAQSNAGNSRVHLLYHALGSRFRSLSRGCEDWNEASEGTRRNGRPSLLHTLLPPAPRPRCHCTHTVLHLSGNSLPCPCVPAQPLFKSTPEDKLFTRSPPKSDDRHIIRTCTRSVIPFETCSDDGNNHSCSGEYLLLQLRNPFAWQITMWPTPFDSLVRSSARLLVCLSSSTSAQPCTTTGHPSTKSI